MNLFLAVIVGILYAGGMYMMLRRSIVKLIIGLILLSHGANLFIFVISRITRGTPPLIEESSEVLKELYADPVPHALILTAIVISFGVQAFAIVLIKKVYQGSQTDDLDELITTDQELIEFGE
ncbi:MAG: Na+/H+ antiporter subunit C [Bacteroidetes bacterium]|nr:Na+/H+ antiporter subunit C [Bacteroidota bacterium]HET6244490.1 Na+/H+ antiporter subunit C [Bacteroidia bacterium]